MANTEQRNHEWEMENTRQGVEYAREGLRTMIILNGGALVAMLAFVGSIADAERITVHPGWVMGAFGLFVAGLVSAAITFVVAYISQLYFAQNNQTQQHLSQANLLRKLGLSTAIGSLCCFILGAFACSNSITITEKEWCRMPPGVCRMLHSVFGEPWRP